MSETNLIRGLYDAYRVKEGAKNVPPWERLSRRERELVWLMFRAGRGLERTRLKIKIGGVTRRLASVQANL